MFIAIILILFFGICGPLTCQWVLQLRCDDWDAIDAQGYIDDAAAVLTVRALEDRGEANLPGDREAVLRVGFSCFWVHPRVRMEIGHAEGLAIAFETVAQQPISAVMKSWIEQRGFPIITVKRQGPRLVLTQKRFTYLPNDSDQKWQIPITIRLFPKTLKSCSRRQNSNIQGWFFSNLLYCALAFNQLNN